jgi:hypothetical protein
LKLQTARTLRLLLILLGLLPSLAAGLRAEETNVWPLWVGQTETDAQGDVQNNRWDAAGPFFFHYTSKDGQTSGGFRPVYVESSNSRDQETHAYVLYPLFSYHRNRDGYRWSLFSLINHYEATGAAAKNPTAGKAAPGGFDLWPVYFSRETGNPATSYHAVMPIYGDIKNRFGMDRLTWTLFPIYSQAEKRHVKTTAVLWPVFRTISGEGNHGVTVWPLFGFRSKEGAYREQFYLWPLIYKDEHALWQEKPDVRFGVLPFYASEQSAKVSSETFVGPFFGYTDRKEPYRYHEVRYFWPFFVQGEGDNISVNRWGPFYTHSIRKGIDKTWVLWPLWRHQEWTESGLKQTRNQVFWFVYHSTVQRSAKNPNLPAAHKTHLWPLFSAWNNGAGQKQIQALSLFGSLFPYNEPLKITYDPLFALYRFDQESPDDRKHTFLWNFVSWHRSPKEKEFHVGPVISSRSSEQTRRIAFGCGLFGFERQTADSGWKPFFFEFKRRNLKPARHQP